MSMVSYGHFAVEIPIQFVQYPAVEKQNPRIYLLTPNTAQIREQYHRDMRVLGISKSISGWKMDDGHTELNPVVKIC